MMQPPGLTGLTTLNRAGKPGVREGDALQNHHVARPPPPLPPPPHFQDAAQSCSDFVAVIAPGGEIRSVAGNGLILGYTPQEVIGLPYARFIHPDDLRGLPSDLGRLAQTFDNAIRMVRLRASDGRWVWVQVLGADLLDAERIGAMIFSFHAAESVSRGDDPAVSLDDPCGGVNEAIMITDAEPDPQARRIVYVNQTFTKMTGYRPREVLGQTPALLYGSCTSRPVLDRLRETTGRGEAFHGEAISYRKDGSEFWMDWSVLPVRDPADQVVRWVWTQRDITRQKLLQEGVTQLATCEQRRVAEDLHDSLQQVLVAAGMQLQTLMSRLQRGGHTQEAQLGNLIADTIEEAVEQSRGLVRWLNPVQLQTGGLIDALQELTESIRRLFRMDVRFVGPDHVDVDGCVAMHVYRVVQEAIHNVMKHARATRLDISLTRHGAWGEIAIDDNGTGLPASALRGDLGMGLRLMDYRARLAGGDLQLEPGEAGGTRVRCRFPLQSDETSIGSPSE